MHKSYVPDTFEHWCVWIVSENNVYVNVVQVVMSNLRGELSNPEMQMYEQYDMAGDDEQIRGVNDQDWDLWEEWMGWEGVGIRDYSSHINPYIWSKNFINMLFAKVEAPIFIDVWGCLYINMLIFFTPHIVQSE